MSMLVPLAILGLASLTAGLTCQPNGHLRSATTRWCNSECNAAGFPAGSSPNCVAYCTCAAQPGTTSSDCFLLPPFDRLPGVSAQYCRSLCANAAACPTNMCSPGCLPFLPLNLAACGSTVNSFGAPNSAFRQINLNYITLTNPTRFPNADDFQITVSSSFPLLFDGSSYTSFTLSSNGWLSFIPGASAGLDPSGVPDPFGPNAGINIFHTDLVIDSNVIPDGRIDYQDFGNVFVIQFTNVETYFDDGTNINLQLQIFRNGDVQWHFNSWLIVDEDFCLAGVQSTDGTIARAIFFGQFEDLTCFRGTAWTINTAARFSASKDEQIQNAGPFAAATESLHKESRSEDVV